MLPHSPRSWFSNYDAFRSVPKELAEATAGGAVMTLIAIVMCVVLFVCEASAFMTTELQTRIVIDSNKDAALKINFDIQFFDLSCDHATVGVWDSFGNERMNITKDILKQRIDKKGVSKGHPYTEDELAELEFSGQMFSEEELAELDSDWGSSSDHFKHDSFDAVIEAHDFTMINFYADWCGHCQMFAPTWVEFENKLNQGTEVAKDADGNAANVRALRINCVDFEAACRDQRISSFPSVRLYRRGAKTEWASYNSFPRTLESLSEFLHAEVVKRHIHTGATFHEIFAEGCRISGFVEVSRVPGTIHFQAVHSKTQNLNPAFTNVSHTVHHFSFGEAPRRAISQLPPEYKEHVNPLDGRTFAVDKFHKAPNHFIKVVHTRFQETGLRSYQQTHQWSIRTLQRNAIPQAKFSYDLSPVEVVVSKGQRRWYDFMTQVFAIIGGAFTVFSMGTGMMRVTAQQLKSVLNKLN